MKKDWIAIMAIVAASGFSCMTYMMGIPFINSLLTISSPLSEAELGSMNISLILVDIAMLPLCGLLAAKFGKEKFMLAGAAIMVITAIPLFHSLNNADYMTALFARLLIIIAGVAFAAPFRLWAKELIPVERRCTSLNIGCTLGHFLIEAPAGVVCLWAYQSTGWIGSPGIYFAIIALLAVFAVYRK